MKEPIDSVPAPSSVQYKRSELLLELEYADMPAKNVRDIENLIDGLMVEAVVITAAELLRGDCLSLDYSFLDVCQRLHLKAPVSKDELLDRVCGDVALRRTVYSNYQRIRALVSAPPSSESSQMVAFEPQPPAPASAATPPAATAATSRRLKTVALTMLATLLFVSIVCYAVWSLSHLSFSQHSRTGSVPSSASATSLDKATKAQH